MFELVIVRALLVNSGCYRQGRAMLLEGRGGAAGDGDGENWIATCRHAHAQL